MFKLTTQRFGIVQRNDDDIITFPGGIHGFELQRAWILLGDREHGGLFWLQNAEHMELSFALLNPREFVPDYTLHVQRKELASIWKGTEALTVLVVLTEYQDQLHLNLRNPIVINSGNRYARQVVACDDRPLQYVLSDQPLLQRKSA